MRPVIDLVLYRLGSRLRVLLLFKIIPVPAVMPKVFQFLGRIHEEVAVVLLSGRRIAVVPLTVYIDVIPVMSVVDKRLSRDDHVLDSRGVEKSLRGHSEVIAVALSLNESVISGSRPG